MNKVLITLKFRPEEITVEIPSRIDHIGQNIKDIAFREASKQLRKAVISCSYQEIKEDRQ